MSPAKAFKISHMTFMSQVIGSKKFIPWSYAKKSREEKVAAGCVFLYTPTKHLQLYNY